MTARLPQPRRIRLDGVDSVVLTADAYQRLDAIRRQAGAQANRLHSLRQQLATATAALTAIDEAARQTECATGPDGHTTPCLRAIVLAILDSEDAATTSTSPARSPAAEQSDTL